MKDSGILKYPIATDIAAWITIIIISAIRTTSIKLRANQLRKKLNWFIYFTR